MRRLNRSPATVSAVAYGVGIVSALGTMAVLARSGDGQFLVSYNLGLSIMMIGGQVLSLGLPVGVLAYFRETLDGATATSAARHAANRSALSSLAPLLIWAAVGVSVGEFRFPALIFLSASLLMVSNKILIAGASVSQRSEALGLTTMIRFLLHLAGSVLIVRLFGLGTELGPPVLLVLGEIGGFVYLRLTVKRVSSLRHEPISRLVRRSLVMWPSILVLDVNTRIDLLCLSLLGRPDDVVFYGLFVLVADGLLSFFMLGRTEAEPLVAVAHRSSSDAESAADHLRRTARMSPLLATVGLGGLLAVSPVWAPVLLGRTMTLEAAVALLVLSLATTLASAGVPYAFCRSILGDPWRQNATYAMFLLVNVLVNVALIGAIGSIGAAVGTLLGNLSYVANRRWVSAHVRRLRVEMPSQACTR